MHKYKLAIQAFWKNGGCLVTVMVLKFELINECLIILYGVLYFQNYVYYDRSIFN